MHPVDTATGLPMAARAAVPLDELRLYRTAEWAEYRATVLEPLLALARAHLEESTTPHDRSQSLRGRIGVLKELLARADTALAQADVRPARASAPGADHWVP